MLPDGGIYQLLLSLEADLTVTIGRLGAVELPAGWYVYTGSMRRGLAHRLARHQRRDKPLRWHIDYLTTLAPPVATRWWPLDGTSDQECRTHATLAAHPGVTLPARGFGSSDCRCAAHLVRLPDRTLWPPGE